MTLLQYITSAMAIVTVLGFAMALKRMPPERDSSAITSDMFLALSYLFAVNAYQVLPGDVKTVWQIFDLLVLSNLVINLRYALRSCQAREGDNT